ncbi:putative membrane protein [Sphaerotilus hippei]|uniref:Putative membrane protein n=1 Tax=Sphaerotilus hippei TaxID=744406 RepID=A0A318GWC3_9BURK|nr:DUF599 domain-containing protein [Sphaerotilus hippei]PXW92886.1 putative membrane protein [Sphaerotilus hippei]
MEFLLRMIKVLPLADWLALGAFFAGWVGYVHFAKARAQRRPSVLASTNRIRKEWMLQTTYRENRIVDGAVAQSMASSPSFFASTTIFIIGGLMAAIGATDKASELVQELPFAARTSTLVLDLKLLVLTGIFVHAFFRFTWSMRQYSFGALLIGAAPSPKSFETVTDAEYRRRYADRSGRVMGLAAETFNDGLRAVYFSFAAVLWFLSPLAMVLGTASVIWVLYQREFHSEVVAMLNEQV